MIHIWNFINSNLFALIMICMFISTVILSVLALCRCSKNREELEEDFKIDMRDE